MADCSEHLPLMKQIHSNSTLHLGEFSHSVAVEKWLGVWHDAGGADHEVAAKRLPIGQPDVNGPGFC